MTLPDDSQAPPSTVGSQPARAADVNNTVGTHLRAFIENKNAVHQDQDFFAGTDLKADPYWFTADQETELKTAISQLDQALAAIDMTFISRVVGMG